MVMASIIAQKKPLLPPKSPILGSGLSSPTHQQHTSLESLRTHNRPMLPPKNESITPFQPSKPENIPSNSTSPPKTSSSPLDKFLLGPNGGVSIEDKCTFEDEAVVVTIHMSNGEPCTIVSNTQNCHEQLVSKKSRPALPPVSPKRIISKSESKKGPTPPLKTSGKDSDETELTQKNPVLFRDKPVPVPGHCPPERQSASATIPQCSSKSGDSVVQSSRVRKGPTPPPKSPVKSRSSSNSSSDTSSVESGGKWKPTPPPKSPELFVKSRSSSNSSSDISSVESGGGKWKQIPPPKSPFTSPSKHGLLATNGVERTKHYPIVPPKSVKVEITKVAVPRSETKSNMRLIRIEPTMPTDGSSVYLSGPSSLSQLKESSDESPFPCSISPGTMCSMELLFSFSDVDILDKLADSWPVKCTYIVKEMILTERAYVQALTDVIKGYLTPLYSYVLETGESPNFITAVFGNIVKIHQIHTALLKAMQSASNRPEEFAQVFLDCDFISQYTFYCTGYSKGNKRLEQTMATESDLKQFIMDCQTKLNHTLPLTSYLIKPVQRILKYPLFLEDLSKKFDWLDHPGHRLLQQALNKASSDATQINTAFQDPIKFPKNSPKATAQKRFNQIRDLQKSRSLETRQVDLAHSPITQTNSLPQVYREALFPVPSKHNTLTSCRFSSLKEKSTASVLVSSIQVSGESEAQPRVKDLKSFYERLTERSEEEMMNGRYKTGSKMTRTNSLGDSFVNMTSVPVSRTSSLGNLFSRFGHSSINKDKHSEPEHRSLLRRFRKNKKSKSNNSA